VADRERQVVLVDQRPRRRLVVGGQRDDAYAELGQAVLRSLQRAQLGVAVRAPRASEPQHDGVAACERVRELKRVAVGQRHREGGKGVSGMQQLHVSVVSSLRPISPPEAVFEVRRALRPHVRTLAPRGTIRA
jgi:hypothetical protein